MRILPLDDDTLEMFRNYVLQVGPLSRGGKQLIFGINRHHAWRVVRDCAARAGLGTIKRKRG